MANYLEVPLVILAVVGAEFESSEGLGHKHHTAMTSRRLAFIMEALSECVELWESIGCAVFVRVHGEIQVNDGNNNPKLKKFRIMDHLTLASRACAVITDEPFVRPYLSLVEQVERACSKTNVTCLRVDGSMTVPARVALKHCCTHLSIACNGCCKINYKGLPTKAWRWEEKTKKMRSSQLEAALCGHFDTPVLDHKISCKSSRLLEEPIGSNFTACERAVSASLPALWKKSTEIPGIRPFSSTTMEALRFKQWAIKWCSAEADDIRPCSQTVGTPSAGLERWEDWLARDGLKYYARNRNNIRKPHSPSRLSCYLNFGTISIFRIAAYVLRAQKGDSPLKAGAEKFHEELIKWREFSYAACISRRDYSNSTILPNYAIETLQENNNANSSYVIDLSDIASGRTHDDKWNAMQNYLVSTGELHNNARMTWGKAVVHWGVGKGAEKVLEELIYLNDRFALDGLSPPSYGGILWCFGWGDKPGNDGRISTKPTSRYRQEANAFKEAEDVLLSKKNASKRTIQSYFSGIGPSKSPRVN